MAYATQKRPWLQSLQGPSSNSVVADDTYGAFGTSNSQQQEWMLQAQAGVQREGRYNSEIEGGHIYADATIGGNSLKPELFTPGLTDGVRAGFTLGGVNWDPGKTGESGFWGGANAVDVNAGAYNDGDMGSIGWNAHLGSVSAGYSTVDAESDHDRGMKAGVSFGLPSLGARFHHGDADQDGETEYGFGFHCPTPLAGVGVSFDYTTETPLGDLASVAAGFALAGPVGAAAMMGANWGMDAVGLGDYAPGTLLADAGDWLMEGGLGETAEGVGDWMEESADWASDTASDAWDWLTE